MSIFQKSFGDFLGKTVDYRHIKILNGKFVHNWELHNWEPEKILLIMGVCS